MRNSFLYLLITSNHLPTLAWVKNVYSLCVEGVVNRAQSYTTLWTKALNHYTVWVQTISYTHSVDSFPPSLYTPKIQQLTDTRSYFSPLSTAPTINKKKEN